MSKNRVTTVYCMSALRNVHLLSETQMTMQQNWYHSPHLTVSLGLLTGSGPSASSLHFISLTLSLGEIVIYHRHGKHSCGACVGLIFFGPRTALSLDAFCLFPQAVPPSSPWGGVQMRWPASTPGILRCAPLPGGTQAKMLLWGSHPSPLAAPDKRALRSGSHHAPAPAGCLQRSHPSSLPGFDLRSPRFSTQPPSASGISGRGAQGHDCPFFLLQTGCCAFL